MKKHLLLSLIFLAHGAPASAMLRTTGRLLFTAAQRRSATTTAARITDPHILAMLPCIDDTAAHTPFLAYLIEHKTDLTLPELTPFWHVAAQKNVTDLVKTALKHNSKETISCLAQAGAQFSIHETCLAVPHSEILQSMIAHGAPINTPSSTDKNTPLIRAIKNNHALSTTILLNAGANPNQGPADENPFILAVQKADEPLVKALIAAGEKLSTRRDPTALYEATKLQRTYISIARMLAKYHGTILV